MSKAGRMILLLVAVLPLISANLEALSGDDAALWVYFQNRPESAYQAAPALSARALERKQGAGIGPQPSDYPVWEPWVSQVEALGATVRIRSRYLNAISVNLSSAQLPRLRALPFVTKVEPVRQARRRFETPETSSLEQAQPALPPEMMKEGQIAMTTAVPNLNDYGSSYLQLASLGVVDLHQRGNLSGEGILIAILDSGFHKDHYALSHLDIVAEYDFIDDDEQTQNYDGGFERGDFHGTYTLSALAGYVPGQLIGPAFGASFLLARTEELEFERRLEEDKYVAGLEWAGALGAQIISTSLGYWKFVDDNFTYPADSLDGITTVTTRAVNAAFAEGILVVTAAGNEGPLPSTLNLPGDSPYALTVGAESPWGEIANFSSRGPTFDGRVKPDLVAQGRHTVCARWEPPDLVDIGFADGTSLATPLIAGLAALLLESNETFTAADLLERLRQSGDRAEQPDNTFGYGRPSALLAQNPDIPYLTIDSLIWHSPPVPGRVASVSIQLQNRGTTVSMGDELVLIPNDESLESGGIGLPLTSLEAEASAVIGPWQIDIPYSISSGSWVWFAWRLYQGETTLQFGGEAFQTTAAPPAAELTTIQCRPNPWSPRVNDLAIEYYSPVTEREMVSTDLVLIDSSGRCCFQISSLALHENSLGKLDLHMDPGEHIPTGVYLLQVSDRYGTANKRVTLFR
jgi:subtilisin family serine protease